MLRRDPLTSFLLSSNDRDLVIMSVDLKNHFEILMHIICCVDTVYLGL